MSSQVSSYRTQAVCSNTATMWGHSKSALTSDGQRVLKVKECELFQLQAKALVLL